MTSSKKLAPEHYLLICERIKSGYYKSDEILRIVARRILLELNKS